MSNKQFGIIILPNGLRFLVDNSIRENFQDEIDSLRAIALMNIGYEYEIKKKRVDKKEQHTQIGYIFYDEVEDWYQIQFKLIQNQLKQVVVFDSQYREKDFYAITNEEFLISFKEFKKRLE